MTQLEQAARQALKFVVGIHPAFICEAMNHTKAQRHSTLDSCPHIETQRQVAEALRAALEQPAQGCDYCNHPQYAGIKCKNCGRMTEQPAQDEPVAHMNSNGVVRAAGYPWGSQEVLTPLYTHPQAREPDYWQEEARRYAQNADFWREKYESATAQDEPVALKKGECWPEYVMQEWDYWRKQIADGDKGSAPRDWFEELAELKLVSCARCGMLEMEIKALEEKLSEARGQPAQQEPVAKLWLWRNFVNGRPEYWAFDNPYPINLDNDDPQTLGSPCGYALLKPSRDGSRGRTEDEVLREINGALAREHTRPQAREPFTLSVVREKARLKIQEGHSYRGCWDKTTEMLFQVCESHFMDGFRSAEAAHGIGEKK